MKKTLIFVVHPNLQESVINKRWIEELQKYPDRYHIHDLYGTYPDEKLNIKNEQKLIENYDKIIFQFPFYWFSSPPLLKKWFDEILVLGWAYSDENGYAFLSKKIGLAISIGGAKEVYSKEGYTIKDFLKPFESTFNYIKADYQSFYAYYGMETNVSEEWIEKSIPGYLSFVESM